MRAKRAFVTVVALAATVTFCDLARTQTPPERTAAGHSDRARANRLFQKVSALREEGKYAEALSVAKEFVEATKAGYGPESRNYAVSLNNLAWFYDRTGDRAKAAQLCEQALAILKKTLGENHPNYIMALNNLAGLYEHMGQHDKAAPLHEQALAIRKKAQGENDPNYAASLNDLAREYEDAGNFAKAEPLFQQALAIRKKVPGENHPDYALSLNNLAGLYRDLGEYAKAEPLCRQAVAVQKNALGENDFGYALYLNNLAELYKLMGEYAKAKPLYQQALAVTKKAKGENDLFYAGCLNNLAGLHKFMGEYALAEPLYRQVLAIQTKARGENHPSCAAYLNNLAGLYECLGEYAKAEPLYLKALAIYKEAPGENDLGCAVYLNNLAGLYESMHEYAKAKPLYLKALAIQKNALGENHPGYALSLNNLAGLYESMGEYAEAEPLCRQALAIQRKTQGENHPGYGTYLHNLAGLYAFLGEYAKAEPLYQQALAITKKTLGEYHPGYAGCLNGQGWLYAAWDKPEQALPCFAQGLESLHEHTARVLIGLPERRQIAYARHVWSNVEVFLSFVRQHVNLKGAEEQGAEWLARWKALATEAQTERQRLLRQSADPTVRNLIGQLTTARQELAQLTLSPPPKMGPEEVRRRQIAAETRVQELESKLAQKSSQFAEQRRIGQAKLVQIAAAMPAQSVLLDYARFHDCNFKPVREEHGWGDSRYVVFITTAGQQPQPVLVDLGPAKPIDDAIADFRKTMGRAEKGQRPTDDQEIREKLLAIRKLVIDPALPHIRDKRHWIVCPDGQLALVPFEALPVKDGKYLIEIKKLSYLGAGREAVAYAGSSPPAPLPQAGGGSLETTAKPAVLVGDPDFDLSPEGQLAELQRIKLAEDPPVMRGVGGSREQRQVLFSPLPATGNEVATAAELIGGRKYVQRQALKGVVKRVSAPGVLYLATHGFFLPDQPQTPEKDTLSLATLTTRGTGFGTGPGMADFAEPGSRIENPLLRCGLALAGANRREAAQDRDDVDDGILTGMEVAGLDLWGTKLVVLSACETGLGDVQVGEGVMGLRRAFFLAGARRVLSTLWMVPDRETQALMTDFITRWKAGTPGVDALRDAQIALIQQMRKQHGHAHPFYWAAFTMTGDWR